ncbi:AT-rich interactive domain-containing protein 4B-like isoform X2 [Dysidea avara]
MIKGSLKPGSRVEAKHSDGTYHSATIIRVTDASVYTVVFDDGDEVSLRRSSLCLQGARHFKESQTLDQLPLTDPENFGTPVMLSKRRRRHVSESSDDESEAGYQPKKINIAKDYPIGTILFLENDRRKSSWLPVVVVPTKCVIEECQPSPNPICVRSFRDGRFYTAEPNELHEFATDKEPLLSMLNGELYHTHKQAVEKAMTYLNTQELPWDMDMPHKKQHQKKQSAASTSTAPVEQSSPAMVKTEDMPEPSSVEREKFITELKQFHLDRGTPMTRPPVLSQKTLDLFRLYHLVQEYGGMEKVTQDMKWKYLYNQLGLSSQITSASYSLKMAYKKHLYPFEEHQRNKKGGRDDKKGNNGEEDDSAAPDQSGDEESGSISSGKSSSNGEPESDSNAGPPDDLPDHNSQSDEAMDTTNSVVSTEDEKPSAPCTYAVGEMIKVWYGKGKFLKQYIAKIMDSTMESGMREYYVHYSGWNTRYDEWVPEERIAARIAMGNNERIRPSTAKKKQLPKARRGRPPQSAVQQPHPPDQQQHSKVNKSQKIPPAAVAVPKSSPVKPNTPAVEEGNTKPSPAPATRGPGRPKKKRLSTPVPTVTSPDATPTTVAATIQAPPSTATTKDNKQTDEHTQDITTPPSSQEENKPTKATTAPKNTTPKTVPTTSKSSATTKTTPKTTTTKASTTPKMTSTTTKMTSTIASAKGPLIAENVLPPTRHVDDDDDDKMDNDFTTNTEQLTGSNSIDDGKSVDSTASTPVITPVLEDVMKKEDIDENDVPIHSPKLVISPVHSPKEKTPPSTEEPPCPEVIPPPVAPVPTTPIKEETAVLQQPQEETPQCKKKRGTPDGKKKKTSLQERRREQASDWIVDFSKLPEMDSAGRIALLTEKIGAIQKRYAELKSEVAYLDRKRRRAKQREREAMRNNHSPVVECQ